MALSKNSVRCKGGLESRSLDLPEWDCFLFLQRKLSGSYEVF